MGETAPAQTAVGGYVSMLGVGMVGTMPARVNGPMAASRGSTVPQLHSAIVERLRARIELCRRHHSTCERRYQRGQAENSDREHENTLHLLNLVNQSSGSRKIRGGRSVGQQSEFNRFTGDQRGQNVETEPKAVTRNLVHGSLRRKIEGHPSGFKKNGATCLSSADDLKRMRLDSARLQAAPCGLGLGRAQNPVGQNPMSQPLHPLMPHSLGSDLFNITLRDMKKEPVEVQTCCQTSADVGMFGFEFKEEGGGQIDPELQELFDELTKSVPSLNDLELERILKQEDPFQLELGRPSSTGSTNPCLLLEKQIKTEYSPDFNLVTKNSPQHRPASAGPTFPLDGSVQIAHGQAPQGSAGLSRAISGWPELSHAEQLKQMAANQQQPCALLHHPQQSHQNPTHQATWSMGVGAHPSGAFAPGNKLPNVPTMSSHPLNPLSGKQAKSRNNCLFKRNGFNNGNYTDLKALNSKPMLQFTPKVEPSNGHPISHGSLPQGKVTSKQTQQEQKGTAAQSKNHSAHQSQTLSGLNYQNQQVNPAASQCLPGRGNASRQCLNQHGPGIHNKASPQQQDKGNVQDNVPFSHHLAIPPPDYEQARTAASRPQAIMYTGIRSSQPVSKTSPDQSDLQGLSFPLPSSQASKSIPSSSDGFPSRPDLHQGPCVQPCVGQLRDQQQQFHSSSDSRMGGLHPHKLLPQHFGTSTVPNIQPHGVRAVAGQRRLVGPGLRVAGAGNGGESGLSWAKGHKQTEMDMKRKHGPGPSPNSQPDMSGQRHFPSPGVGPPNQVAPHGGIVPLRGLTSRASPSLTQPQMANGLNPGPMATPGPNLNPASMAPEPVCPDPFPLPPQSLRGYQQSNSNRPGQHTFDFLPEGDNTVPGVNTDSDFIDSLLKSGTGNDDWMKDINLEEILGGNS